MGKDYVEEASLTDGKEMCVIVSQSACSASLLREIIPIVILTLDPCLPLPSLNKQISVVTGYTTSFFLWVHFSDFAPTCAHPLAPASL